MKKTKLKLDKFKISRLKNKIMINGGNGPVDGQGDTVFEELQQTIREFHEIVQAKRVILYLI